MEREASQGPLDPLRRLTLPVGILVAGVLAFAWHIVWSASDFTMAALMVSPSGGSPLLFPLIFLPIVVMMVAMMLPSALPMVLAYRSMSQLENGRLTRPQFAWRLVLQWPDLKACERLDRYATDALNGTGSGPPVRRVSYEAVRAQSPVRGMAHPTSEMARGEHR